MNSKLSIDELKEKHNMLERACGTFCYKIRNLILQYEQDIQIEVKVRVMREARILHHPSFPMKLTGKIIPRGYVVTVVNKKKFF
eukprot:UN04337